MVQTCIVCKKEAYPGCALSFHRLPVNEKLKNEWMEALKLTRKLSKYSVVCSLHFNEEDFLTAAKKRLKTDAIPFVSRKDPSKEETQQESCSIHPTASEQIEPGPSGESSGVCKKIKVQSEKSTQTQAFSTPREAQLRRKVKILNQQLQRKNKKIESMRHILKAIQKKTNNGGSYWIMKIA